MADGGWRMRKLADGGWRIGAKEWAHQGASKRVRPRKKGPARKSEATQSRLASPVETASAKSET